MLRNEKVQFSLMGLVYSDVFSLVIYRYIYFFLMCLLFSSDFAVVVSQLVS